MKRAVGILMGSIVTVVVLLDQVTKLLIVANFKLHERLEVIPGVFNLTLTYNKGIAFGLLSDVPYPYRQILISVATTLALAVIGYFLFRHYLADRRGQFALALVVGGAIGNVIDRVRLGEVIDFLDFYYGANHWPAFNVADSAVCIGVCILLLLPTHQSSHSE